MNKLSSCADNKWYLPIDLLPSEFLLYLIDDIRCGFVVGLVLFSVLIKQSFPDPSVACFTLGLNQETWLQYANDCVVFSVNGLLIQHPGFMDQVESRGEQITNLRAEAGADSNQDIKLGIFRRIVSTPFPTLPYGGARLIHQVRTFFLDTQFPALRELATPTRQNLNFRIQDQSPDLQAIVNSYVKFGRTFQPDQLIVQPPVFSYGLVPSPSTFIQVTGLRRAIKARTDTLKPGNLNVFAKRAGISMGEVLFEVSAVF